MLNPILKIKKQNPRAKIPRYEVEGAAGMDISACLDEPVKIYPGCHKLIDTGLQVGIPVGFELQIRPRSGLAVKKCVTVLNSPGTIDFGFRGQVKVILINFGAQAFTVNHGDRIAQIILAPVAKADITEVSRLDDTDRGEGGFGSSGLK